MTKAVQNSRRGSAGALERRRSRPSNNRPRPRHGGGRPLSFIAALVVAEAARLYKIHRRWPAVFEALEREGNGTYARNTLIRRVAKYSAGQNSARPTPPAGRARVARARSRTRDLDDDRHPVNGWSHAGLIFLVALSLFSVACGPGAGPDVDSAAATGGAGGSSSCAGCWRGSECVPLERQTEDLCGEPGEPCAPTRLECGGRGRGACSSGEELAARHACHEPAGQSITRDVCCAANVCIYEACR
jgi:hypothetical protein